MVKNEIEKKFKSLKLYNGVEYYSNEFDHFCSYNGIRRENIVLGTPQENGVSEKIYKIIMELARCMRLDTGLSLKFWEDVVDIVVYLINRGLEIPWMVAFQKIHGKVRR